MLNQDFVVRLKYQHEKLGGVEFVIPNNCPTVEALEVLAIWQKVLVDSLKQKEEPKAEESAPNEGESCQPEQDHSDS